MPPLDNAADQPPLQTLTLRLFRPAGVWIGKTPILTFPPIDHKWAFFYLFAHAPAQRHTRGRVLPVAELFATIWNVEGEDQIANKGAVLNTLKADIMRHIKSALGDNEELAEAYLSRERAGHGRQAAGDGALILCPAAPLRIDIQEFEKLCARAANRTDNAKRLRKYEEALRWHRGPMLANERLVPDSTRRRDQLEQLFHDAQRHYADALAIGIEDAIAQDRVADAETYLRKLTKLAENDASIAERAQHLRGRIAAHKLTWTIQPNSAPGPPTEDLYDLPEPRAPFVGREQTLKKLAELATAHRLVTLIGPGGVGKTRLALELARQRPTGWFDTVVMVALESIIHDERVSQQVAAALRIRDNGGHDPADRIVALLRSKRALIILDNCEHLVVGVRSLCQRLLDQCPQVRIIAASQCTLGLEEEQPFPVDALPTPSPDDHLTPKALLEQDCVKLFLQYACMTQENQQVPPETLAAIVTICQRLDGLPLALELAAAQLQNMAPLTLARRLDDALAFRRATDPRSSPRHLTMAATIRWTYKLLTETQQRLFRRLAVFTGAFSLDSAREICRDERVPTADIEAHLSALTRLSLVILETSDSEPRYRFLRIIHDYALELFAVPDLDGEPSAPVLRRAHAQWFATFAERQRPHLTTGRQLAALIALDTDHLNLRAAFQWAHDQVETEIALRLAAALWRFWWMRGYFTQERGILADALAMPGALPNPAEALRGLSADALCGLAILTAEQGEYELARHQIERSIALREQIHDVAGQAESLGIAGRVAYGGNDSARARDYIERSLALWTQLDDTCGIADANKNMGTALYYLKEYGEAHHHLSAALDRYRSCRDYNGIGYALINLANVHYQQRRYEVAEALYLESLAIRWMLGSRMGIATCLQGLIWNARQQAKFCRVAWLLGVEEGLRENLGLMIPDQDRSEYTKHIEAASEALKALSETHHIDNIFDLIHRDACQTPLDHALAALLVAMPRDAPSNIPERTHADFEAMRKRLRAGLSKPHLEIARLTADGYTAPGIARQEHMRTSAVKVIDARAATATKVLRNLDAAIAILMGG